MHAKPAIPEGHGSSLPNRGDGPTRAITTGEVLPVMVMHGGPKSDEVRKSMFETLCHTCVAALVVVGATVLAFKRELDPTAWAAACATAITASGAVTVVRRSEVDRPAEPPATIPQPLVVVDRRSNGETE